MKNKKLKYVLIPVVIVVWGLVFYKVFNYANDDIVLPSISNQLSKSATVESQKDTFSLSLQYQDPFLKKNRIIRKESTEAQELNTNQANTPLTIRHSRRRRTKPTPKQKLSEISYGGEIINANTKNVTAVIKINGKNKLLSKGDIVGDVEILKVYTDSIILKDQGVDRTIKKNQR
jgi:hypothetical protein